MPYDASQPPHKRIAVIGAGISGMGAAYHLADTHHVTLFEQASRLGGHARTIIAGKRGDQPVDTGFIVFNHVNYPHLTRLFDDLNVPTAPSQMSFAASIDGGRVEYALNSLDSLFAQRRNLASPKFLGMMLDVLRFNKNAEALVQDETMTIRQLLTHLGVGDAFRDHYLLPFSGAIWSTPTRDILDFPAAALVRFFRNHALLGITGQHQWHTVQGGSIEYVSRLTRAMTERGVEIRTSAGVQAVQRPALGAQVKCEGGVWEDFDEVIFATHADDSLRLLADASEHERAALSKVRYQPNEAVLHADPALMPARRKCWSSWNYTETAQQAASGASIGLTYWMNALQPIPEDDPLFVTLNATQGIRDDLIHDVTTFRHPMYDLGALEAQREITAMNGAQNTWFCGAWMKNGFHEDGLSSAIDVVNGLSDTAMTVAA